MGDHGSCHPAVVLAREMLVLGRVLLKQVENCNDLI